MYAKQVPKAGVYADSRTMCALAQAAQVALRIWAYSGRLPAVGLAHLWPLAVEEERAQSVFVAMLEGRILHLVESGRAIEL